MQPIVEKTCNSFTALSKLPLKISNAVPTQIISKSFSNFSLDQPAKYTLLTMDLFIVFISSDRNSGVRLLWPLFSRSSVSSSNDYLGIYAISPIILIDRLHFKIYS